MDFQFGNAFEPIFSSNKRYFIISGGRAAGKSTNMAAYFVLKLTQPEYFRGVISRYTQRSLTYSIYKDIIDIIEKWNLTKYIEIKGNEIKCTINNNSIFTHSFRIGDGSQVAKGKGISNPTHLLIDEAQELPSEEEYVKMIDSFRTKDSKTQIFVVFNPGSKRHWIYTRFFLSDGIPNPKWLADHEFIHTTYLDTIDHLDPDKVAEWERMKEIDPEYYDHHILGKWSQGKAGKIFQGWNVLEEHDPEASVTYGLDFGFAGDPTACIEVRKHNQKLWLREICYSKGLTNPDLYDLLISRGLDINSEIIADAAEPKSIEELRKLGFKHIRPCYKGPDSIRVGINKIKTYEVFVDKDSKNLWKEYDLYAWKDGTDKPIDKDNHLMDALRYSLSIDIPDQITAYAQKSYENYKSKTNALNREMYGR